MLRSLWFITKLALLVAAAVWVADNPGTFTVEWLDYTITAHIGVVLVGLILIIAVASYTGRIFAYLTRLPEKIGRYRYIKGSREGVRHLTHGYAALAGGDMSSAGKYAQKAGKKLPDDFHRGLVYSLQAQIAKEKGDEHKRRQILARLTEMDDVAIFGLRGILQDKIEKRDFDGAQKFVDHYLQT